jgi:alkanesulfonate monooxygenase SsuD/methylene tetrahydromethanopterin reductase-like flavin-dependent oxidoreductase (luciferase family)
MRHTAELSLNRTRARAQVTDVAEARMRMQHNTKAAGDTPETAVLNLNRTRAQVTDVAEAREATGRKNSLALSTAAGRACYVADSETEQVEWLSALEGSLARIMKQARARTHCIPLCALITRQRACGGWVTGCMQRPQ